MIEHVKRFEANLELALAIYVNGLEEARIENRLSGSAERIATGIP